MGPYKILLPIMFFGCSLEIEGQSFSLGSFMEGRAVRVTAMTSLNSTNGFTGSGFIIKVDSNYHLITNRHIVENTDYYSKIQRTNEEYYYMVLFCLHLTSTFHYPFQIRKGDEVIFIGNSYNSRVTDIIAINVGPDKGEAKFQEVDLSLNYKLKMGDEIFIVSILDTGNTVGTFSMFSKIISDPEKDYEDPDFGILPVVLIERPSIGGMSGSPVFVWPDKKKNPIFVGILSANASGHGLFWRKSILLDLINVIKTK